MSEENNNKIVDGGGVHPGIVMFLGAALLISSGGNAYYLSHQKTESANCTQSNALLQAQAQADKAKADFGVSIQKRIDNMQMEVAKFCVASHGVPILSGGNVDCKKEK